MNTPPRPARTPAKPSGPTVASRGGRPNTLNLNQRDLGSLLENFDRGEPGSGGRFKRDFVRWPFRHVSIRLDLLHSGSPPATITVACRNLSRGGVSILHSSFMHSGTPCAVYLPSARKGIVAARGVVARCCHRGGVMHEVGVKFDIPIDVLDFVRQDPFQECFSLEVVRPEDLRGSVLYADPSEIDQKIIKHFLRDTHLRVNVAATVEEALQKAAECCDVIISELILCGGSGADLVKQLREEGVTAPAVLVTSDTSPEARAAMQASPAQAYLRKPLTQDGLLRALAEFLIVGRRVKDPSRPTAGAGDVSHLVRGFLQSLEPWTERLHGAIESGDSAACRALCLQIAGTAPALGFADIGQIARQAADALGRAGEIAPAMRPLTALISSCERARRCAA